MPDEDRDDEDREAPTEDRFRERPPDEGRPELSGRDVWRLIRASYAASFPYFVVFLLGLALATWILTTLVF